MNVQFTTRLPELKSARRIVQCLAVNVDLAGEPRIPEKYLSGSQHFRSRLYAQNEQLIAIG